MLQVRIAMDDFTQLVFLSQSEKITHWYIENWSIFYPRCGTIPWECFHCKMIIILGKTMHLNITAEGVETQGQLELLQEYGCDEVQGYFFSRPYL